MDPRVSELAHRFDAIEKGGRKAAEQLLPLVYEELRRLAAQKLAAMDSNQTLQATALVHEAYLRLAKPDSEPCWENQAHFFAAAAEAMRRILVENARRKHSLKRGGDLERVDLEQLQPAAFEIHEDLIALDDALTRLAAEDAVTAELVKLRYYVGCTLEEAAKILDVSPRTAGRLWAYGRAWLREQIRTGTDGS